MKMTLDEAMREIRTKPVVPLWPVVGMALSLVAWEHVCCCGARRDRCDCRRAPQEGDYGTAPSQAWA